MNEEAERAAMIKCVRAWRRVVAASRDGIDSFDVSEIALETGAMVEAIYDPAVHGEIDDCEPGDPINWPPDDVRAMYRAVDKVKP